MAGTCTSIRSRLIGSSSFVELTTNRTGTPFSVRINTKSRFRVSVFTCNAEGPSCIYVGPIETASKETLEALYCQARDSYYSGKPLIVDDMFDRVELKLRWYGSKSVVKYPRCSLRRQSAYADAEEDLSQVLLLASIWILIFTFGASVCLLPSIYTLILAYKDANDLGIGFTFDEKPSSLNFLTILNGVLFMAVTTAIGYPVASSAVNVIRGLWRNDLVALEGACPNCGEQVFAFVRSTQSNSDPHRANCHVCECTLEFRTKVEKAVSVLGRKWVHGRIYLVSGRKR